MSNTKNKKNASAKQGFISKKSLVYGGYSLAMVIIVVVAVVLGNIAISYLDSAFSLRLDVTATHIYTLTDETKTIVGNLEDDIYIYTLFGTGDEDEKVNAIVNRYAGLSMRVHTQNVDPERNPAFVKQFDKNNLGIHTGSIIVTNADQTVSRVIDYENLYVYDSTAAEEGQITMVNVESKLTSAIYHVLSGKTQEIILTQGHGEPASDELSELISFLQDENYDVTLTTLDALSEPLTDEIVMVLNPLVDLTDAEQEQLRTYLDQNGKVVISLSGLRGDVPMPNVDSLLSYYGIQYVDGAVAETDANFYQPPYPMYLLPNYSDHEIVSPLAESGLRVVTPSAGTLVLPTDMSSAEMHVEALLTSSPTSFLKTEATNGEVVREDGDAEGPFTVAAAAWTGDEVTVGSKMLVFTASREALIFPTTLSAYANSDLVANSLAWMRGETDDIFIRGKNVNASRLYFDSYNQVYTCITICVAVIPLIFVVIGLVVYLRRKHL